MPASSRAGRGFALALAIPLLAAQLAFSLRSIEAAFFEARGDAARRAGAVEQARSAYHRANHAIPFDADRLRSEAAATRESVHPAQAAPLYAQSLRRGPYVPLTLVAAAENDVELGRFDEADAVLDTAIGIIGADWRVRLLRGRTRIEQERYAEAEAELRLAAQAVPTAHAQIHYELARALHAQAQYDAALAQAERALALQPQLPEYRVMRAKALMGLNRAPESSPDLAWAVRVYRLRLERGEDALMALFTAENLYALALLADGRFDDAEAAFADLYIRCTPEQINRLAYHLHHIAGEMYDPFPQPSLWAFALDLLVHTGSRVEFEQTLASARMLFAESELDLLIPARSRARTGAGDPEGAMALLAEAPAERADSPPNRLALAEAHAAAGRVAEARDEYVTLLGMSELSAIIRRQAQDALAALPPQ